MFSVDSIRKSISNLYRFGVHEAGYAEASVEAMLDRIDFPTLAQAVRHNCQDVYAFTTGSSLPGFLRYRGRDLFGQRAALLDVIPDEFTPESPMIRHVYELWLLGYGELLTVSSVRISCPCLGGFEAVYREHGRYPWESGVPVDLEELTVNLRKLCLPVYQGKVPLYEQ